MEWWQLPVRGETAARSRASDLGPESQGLDCTAQEFGLSLENQCVLYFALRNLGEMFCFFQTGNSFPLLAKFVLASVPDFFWREDLAKKFSSLSAAVGSRGH